MQDSEDGIGIECQRILKTPQELIADFTTTHTGDECVLEQIVNLFKSVAGSECDTQLLETMGCELVAVGELYTVSTQVLDDFVYSRDVMRISLIVLLVLFHHARVGGVVNIIRMLVQGGQTSCDDHLLHTLGC